MSEIREIAIKFYELIIIERAEYFLFYMYILALAC